MDGAAGARAVGGATRLDRSNGLPRWDFLTNHSHVMLCVAHDNGIRLRDIASAVGITERAAHRILSELVDSGYVSRKREGRRNRYTVKADQPLRHPLFKTQNISDLIDVLKPVHAVEGAN